MTSNAATMSLEEKLVQHIKSDSLLSLVGDEDAILELTRRAIREALFQPIRVPRQYGGVDEKESLVVTTARSVAKQAVERVVDEEIAALTERPEVRAAVREALAATMPVVIRDKVGEWINNLTESAAMEAADKLREAMGQ